MTERARGGGGQAERKKDMCRKRASREKRGCQGWIHCGREKKNDVVRERPVSGNLTVSRPFQTYTLCVCLCSVYHTHKIGH